MLLRLFSGLVAVCLIIIAGTLGYMAVDRSPPITVISARVSSITIPPGGELEWRIRFIQHKRCHIYSERAVFDAKDVRYPLPPLEYKATVGGEIGEEQEIVLKVPIPVDMAFGTARYEAQTIYRCNLLHYIWPIYSPYNPVFFEVVPL